MPAHLDITKIHRSPSIVLDVTPVHASDIDLATGLVESENGTLESREIVRFLEQCGFRESDNDPRLEGVFAALNSRPQVTLADLTRVKRNHLVIQKALHADLAICNFREFTQIISRVFLECVPEANDGKIASYIPQLAQVDPDLWGVSICTVDGQRFSIGDSGVKFSVQSVSKPVTYCIALETLGVKKVHGYVGMEPSGRNFNERVLLANGTPHNPLINTGAIMCSSLLYPELPRWERFEKTRDFWNRLSHYADQRDASTQPEVLTSTFLAERATANRNFCLAHMMAETGLFPSDLPTLERVLDEYFTYCSFGVTTDSMSVLAGTLANGGLNPVTDQRVFSPETVSACLSIMMTCGMYDASGEFSSVSGFPAKSGVSGIIMAVIPGVCGICTYSPLLDAQGNSVKGLRFFEKLAQYGMMATPLQQGTVQTSFGNQFEWRISGNESVIAKFTMKEHSSLWWAAATGDETRIRQLAARGIDVNERNHSGRTALNFALSATNLPNKLRIVQLLIELGADMDDPDSVYSYLEDASRDEEMSDSLIALINSQKLEGTAKPKTPHAPMSLSLFTPDVKVPVTRYFTDPCNISLQEVLVQSGLESLFPDRPPSLDEENSARRESFIRALCGKLVIPNWPMFVEKFKTCVGGESISASVCTLDMQTLNIEHADVSPVFPVQAIVRVVLYEVAIMVFGIDEVHKHVGREPSGKSETSLRMNSENVPYNALTMAGCLTICRLLLQTKTAAEILHLVRFGLMESNKGELGYPDSAVPVPPRYLERVNCVNSLLGSIVDNIPSPELAAETVSVFFQCHSISVDLPILASYGRKLARSKLGHAGVVLALMHSSGMDEMSGEWAFHFGVPGRTSLGGVQLVVIPGIMGYAIRTNESGVLPESVRKFQDAITTTFGFHLFRRHFNPASDQTDPTLYYGSNQFLSTTQLLSAALNGDLSTVKHLIGSGAVDVNAQDMDGRTALHVAISSGNNTIIDWLIKKGAHTDLVDAWARQESSE
jgi:glutaminase